MAPLTEREVVTIKRLFQNPLRMSEFFVPKYFYRKFADMHLNTTQKFLNGKKEITMVVVPRGFGKTSLILYILLLFAGMMLKIRYIVLLEEEAQKAKESNQNIRNAITKEKSFTDFWGDVKGSVWNDRKFQVKSEKFGFDFLVRTMSFNEAGRGLLSEESRPQLIIVNDPEDQDGLAPNPKEIGDKLHRFASVYLPALQAKDRYGRPGRVWWAATTVGEDCLCSRVMEWPNAEVVFYPALDENEKSTWEDMFSTDYLLERRELLFKTGQEAAWWNEFMLNPQKGKRVGFAEPFPRLNVEDLPRGIMIRMAVDAAYSTQRHSDPTGIACGGYAPDGTFYLLYSTEGKHNAEDIIDKIAEIVTAFKTAKMPIEGIYVESLAFEFVRFSLKKSRHKDLFEWMSISQVKHPQNAKISRIITQVLKLYNTKKFMFVGNHPDVENQMRRFPGSKTFGAIDAVAQLIASSHIPGSYEKKDNEMDPRSFAAYVARRSAERSYAELIGNGKVSDPVARVLTVVSGADGSRKPNGGEANIEFMKSFLSRGTVNA